MAPNNSSLSAASEGMVYIVDDDPSVRDALADLLSSVGLHPVTFGTAAEYLACARPDSASCLILDVKLPDINGLDLQSEFVHGQHPPIIFISGYGDIPSTVRAIKAGAIDFLSKPFVEEQLLAAIGSALCKHREMLQQQLDTASLRSRYESLTPREREVFFLVVKGLMNKQSASMLGISEVTLQIHRSQVMRKMKARTLPTLVRMAIRLGVSASDESFDEPNR